MPRYIYYRCALVQLPKQKSKQTFYILIHVYSRFTYSLACSRTLRGESNAQNIYTLARSNVVACYFYCSLVDVSTLVTRSLYLRVKKEVRYADRYYDISRGPGEALGRGWAAGAVLQVRVRVLRGDGRGRRRRGQRGPLARRRGRQVRARAVSAARRAAAPRRAAIRQGRVRAARGGRAGAVGAGRRAAAVAAALRGRHGGVRVGARGLHRGAGMAPARGPTGRGAVRGHGLLPAHGGAARAAGRAGAGVRAAAGHDGVARHGARRGGGAGRGAVPGVGRHPGLQPVRRARAVRAGAGHVHVLPGAAGPGAERTVGEPVSACTLCSVILAVYNVRT